jgi:radical SAM protein with 4Fe4S-binding SPASM domain
LLPDFIRKASQKGYKSVVTTNGTLLPRVGDALIDAGVYKVNLSVHSFEDGTREQFEKYLSDCMDFADKASRAGVLVILRLWNEGFDNGLNEQILTELKARFCDGEWAPSKGGYRIRHRLHLEYGERFEWPDIDIEEQSDDVFCYGLGDHFSVLCDGSVVPCCLDRNAEITLGNILTEDIGDILTSERAENIRRGFECRRATEELCRKCGYAKRFK